MAVQFAHVEDRESDRQLVYLSRALSMAQPSNRQTHSSNQSHGQHQSLELVAQQRGQRRLGGIAKRVPQSSRLQERSGLCPSSVTVGSYQSRVAGFFLGGRLELRKEA